MSVTDWNIQEEWKKELEQKTNRRIQKEPYFTEVKNKPLTPLSKLKEMVNNKYNEALSKIDLHIQSNFMESSKVYIYQSLLPDKVKVSDDKLHDLIREKGYMVKVNYGLKGEVDHLEISGW